ncbi:somatic embryogenesis receptor kinase 1 [Vigna unguiculata]|uniref:non-specific serine/threonine protein kinase n=1 Tax=Vigna unguiculata TaxID=3917 RepID=A0A4D6M3L5_VIGUN|nr:somatic embryogenesis receptor kinase 1 [Vigna unguiculata]
MKVSLSTPFSSIPLWALLVVVSVSAFIVVTCIILCFCFIYYPRKKPYKPRFSLPKSIACKHQSGDFSSSSLDKRLLSASGNVSEHSMNFEKLSSGYYNRDLLIPGQNSNDWNLEGLGSKGKLCSTVNDKSKGWNFSLKGIEDATNGFAKENEVGSGDNGIVYLGLLPSNTQVVVKRLVCKSHQSEELFSSQMEAIGLAKHNNLVKLLGYCAEGAYRMTVSEYVEHESLHHWLHEFPAQTSPLTWDIRKNIIHSVAEGLVYLHDEVKPKILHGSIKASNILLDHKWNPKISDFGLVEVLSSKRSHIILEVEALGSSCEAPDCPASSNLTEGNDIYDFGLLIMEIVSGKIPSYHSQTQNHIVDWLKSMISNGKIENATDPKLIKMPSSKALKQVALVALRCVDPDMNPRLKMRDVVCMLETNILLFEERQIAMKALEGIHSPENQKK